MRDENAGGSSGHGEGVRSTGPDLGRLADAANPAAPGDPPHRHRGPMYWLGRLLRAILGINEDLIADLPDERTYFTRLALQTVIVACIGAFSMANAISMVLNSDSRNVRIASVMGGVVFGLTVFLIDLSVVSPQATESQDPLERARSTKRRVAMALVLGVIVSMPLTARIFAKEANERLGKVAEATIQRKVDAELDQSQHELIVSIKQSTTSVGQKQKALSVATTECFAEPGGCNDEERKTYHLSGLNTQLRNARSILAGRSAELARSRTRIYTRIKQDYVKGRVYGIRDRVVAAHHAIGWWGTISVALVLLVLDCLPVLISASHGTTEYEERLTKGRERTRRRSNKDTVEEETRDEQGRRITRVYWDAYTAAAMPAAAEAGRRDGGADFGATADHGEDPPGPEPGPEREPSDERAAGAQPTPPPPPRRREVFPYREFKVDVDDFRQGGCAVLHLATGANRRVLVKEPRGLKHGVTQEQADAYLRMAQSELGMYQTFGAIIGTTLLAVDHPTGRLAIQFHPRGSLAEYLGIDLQMDRIRNDLTLGELMAVLEQVIWFDWTLWNNGFVGLDKHAGNYVVCGQIQDQGLVLVAPPLQSTEPGALRAIDFGTACRVGQLPALGNGPLMPPEWDATNPVLDDPWHLPNVLWDVYQTGKFARTLLTSGGWGELDPKAFAEGPVRQLAELATTWMSDAPAQRVPDVTLAGPVWHTAVRDQMLADLDEIRHRMGPAEQDQIVMHAGEPNRGPAYFENEGNEYL